MSLENEYFNEKQLINNASEKLEKMQGLNPAEMDEEQLEARERVIKRCKDDIKESKEILEEIKVELYDHIYYDGDVSKKTIESLLADFTNDIFFKQDDDDYDLEVLQEKQNFLRTLL